jgi:hypothetical protein
MAEWDAPPFVIEETVAPPSPPPPPPLSPLSPRRRETKRMTVAPSAAVAARGGKPRMTAEERMREAKIRFEEQEKDYRLTAIHNWSTREAAPNGSLLCDYCHLWFRSISDLNAHRGAHPTLIWPSAMSERTSPPGFELWLGSEKNARDPATLARMGTRQLLNVAKESDPLPERELKKMGVELLHLNELSDIETQDLLSHFPRAFAFMDAAANQGRSLLVHCVQGISRSATFVVAWMIRRAFLANECTHMGCSFQSNVQWVQTRRTIANPNPGFQNQLRTWELELYMLADPLDLRLGHKRPYREEDFPASPFSKSSSPSSPSSSSSPSSCSPSSSLRIASPTSSRSAYRSAPASVPSSSSSSPSSSRSKRPFMRQVADAWQALPSREKLDYQNFRAFVTEFAKAQRAAPPA